MATSASKSRVSKSTSPKKTNGPAPLMDNSTDALDPSFEELTLQAKRLRREILEMIIEAGSGHPGGSFSMVEILLVLYSHFLRHRKPEEPDWEDRDRFILSKGHGAPALYAVLSEFGYVSKEELKSLRKLGSRLQGHPDKRFLPVLEASTGSLGQGLSIGIGSALAARIDKKSYHTYVLLGDGESEEGQIWEGVMFGAQHKLDNLTAIVDVNRIQLDGFTKDIIDMEPLVPKWKSFGWFVQEIDGHDMKQIYDAFLTCSNHQGQPCVIIARTIKGKGASMMENNPAFHGRAPNPEEADLAFQELV